MCTLNSCQRNDAISRFCTDTLLIKCICFKNGCLPALNGTLQAFQRNNFICSSSCTIECIERKIILPKTDKQFFKTTLFSSQKIDIMENIELVYTSLKETLCIFSIPLSLLDSYDFFHP